MTYRVVLVEDELHQQETMISLLRDHPEFELAGIASTIEQGKELLETLKPDLALLDVMVSSETTFDLLKNIEKIDFDIIFTTSYDHFAVKAFRLSAIDYLMKPIDKAEFAGALEKFKERRQGQGGEPNIRNLLANLQLPATDTKTKIVLPTPYGFLYITIKDIVRCESDNVYTTFFTIDNREMIISKTLREVELILVDYGFIRIHNSHLINVEYVNEYIKGEGGFVKMKGGAQLEVSRRRKDEFLNKIRPR